MPFIWSGRRRYGKILVFHPLGGDESLAIRGKQRPAVIVGVRGERTKSAVWIADHPQGGGESNVAELLSPNHQTAAVRQPHRVKVCSLSRDAHYSALAGCHLEGGQAANLFAGGQDDGNDDGLSVR